MTDKGLAHHKDHDLNRDRLDTIGGAMVAPLSAKPRKTVVQGQAVVDPLEATREQFKQAKLERKRYAWVDHFIAVLKQTGNVSKAAASVGVSYSTVYRYRGANKRFAKRWNNAIMSRLDALEESVMDVAVNGMVKAVLQKQTVTLPNGDLQEILVPGYWERSYDPNFALRVLERMRPEKWGEEKSAEQDADAAKRLATALAAMEALSSGPPEFTPAQATSASIEASQEATDDDGKPLQLQSPYGDDGDETEDAGSGDPGRDSGA